MVGYFVRIVFGILLLALPARAALDLSDIGVGARPLGMGKSFVGVADDASAIFINPAGLAQNDNRNVVSMSGQLLSDINYLLLGAADNTPVGKFGLGYVNASVGSIPLTTLVGSGPSLEARQYASADYGSSQFIITYGSKLSRFLKNKAGDNFAVGASLKLFYQGFSGGAAPPSGGANPLTGATGSGLDADLGFLWQAKDWAKFGLVFRNFLPVSFGGKFTWQKNSVVEGIPLVTAAGGQFHLLGPAGLRKAETPLDLTLDFEDHSHLNQPSVWRLGVEYQMLDNLYLRAGLDQKPKAAESGIGVDNNLTAGVGIAFAGFTFDYAYHQFGDISENATHFFSLGYRGLENAPPKVKAWRPEKKKPTIPLPEIVNRPQLKTFSDVPADYWARSPIQYLAAIGIMDGFPDGTYKPTQEVTRGELDAFLAKAKGASISGEANNRKVTRVEAAVLLAKFAGLTLKPKLEQKPFDDIPVNHWAAPAIAADKEAGLLEYLIGRSFGPGIILTRAEAAEMISKTSPVKQKIDKLISGGK